ncbi:GNA1162 family protein [Aliiglaciecola litoralis]|uniref:DUF799 domain-containing protein n=1 Tax=Aliiglaciecola litoralis TaxID=582857 RepID=A0ABP3X5S0_9ALTE
MKFIIKLVAVMSVAVLSGCATVDYVTKEEAFPNMYATKTTSILVVPAVNNTTAAEAADYYATTISEPLTHAGYYVLPIELTTKLIQEQGVVDGAQLLNTDPGVFNQLYGADAVLFVTINEWDTSYYVIGGNVTVGIGYVMKSTATGNVLWQYNDRLVIDTGGDSGGGLIGAIISTAINTALTDYVPVAKRVNYMAISSLPVGSYHKLHGQDRQTKAVNKDKVQTVQE